MSKIFNMNVLQDNPALQALIEENDTKDLKQGDLVEGTVVAIDRTYVFIDLPGYGTGTIYGREFMSAKDVIKNLNIGDSIKGKVVEVENEDGYVEISLKEARQALMWKEADEAMKDKRVFNVTVKSANKGGLIIKWQGIEGFLPASQLNKEHYPRVEDGSKDKILRELKKLVGEQISAAIIASNPKEGKLIFSEKTGGATTSSETLSADILTEFAVGDEIEGPVTGTVAFGLFVKLKDNIEGLVHISEIDWSLVEDPSTLYKVGDMVKVRIIEIKDSKISLSIKALKPNPWQQSSDKYTKGTEVSGVVTKFTKHGAVVAIEEGISGLVHISDFGTKDKLREVLELGKAYSFKITVFDPHGQRMALSHLG